MNVLYFTNTIGMYGANNSLIDMIEILKKRNINIYVAIMERGSIKEELRKRGIRTYIIPYKTCAAADGALSFPQKVKNFLNNIYCMPRIREIIVRDHIDLIHSNASNIDIGAMAALWYGVPHIWHIRELLYDDYRIKYFFPMISKFLMYRADKIIAISYYVQERRKLGKNSVVLYNGFNIDKYKISKEILFPANELHILYCGLISKQKGIMDIVKAIKLLVKKGYKEIKLSIVGGENPYWLMVKEYIESNSLASYIQFYDFQPDLKPYRQWADIGVVSSRCEALGRVTIENMLGEILVIGTKSGATKELIQDGDTGFLYEPGNIEQLAKIIVYIGQNREEAKKIVRNAQEYAVKNFDSVNYADNLLDIYGECVR